MTAGKHIIAIDQGTTSTRAIIFDANGTPKGVGQKELPQHFPNDGWVEHDSEDIWSDTLAVCRDALTKAGLAAGDIAAIGITNQRETAIIWDRKTGQPIHKAIVWQDRRTAPWCRSLVEAGHADTVQAKTGLLIDAYFSASKIAWLLDNVPDARRRAEAGDLAFGTVDSFLLYKLTGGAVHATDATNAARTMIYNIGEGRWDEDLLGIMNIPASLLPQVMDSSAEFGTTDPDLFGAAIPIGGIAGDQHAATVGQACLKPGMIKSTYGTGCFAVLNTGDELVQSQNRLLGTIAYQIGGRTTYAVEGSIFIAGSVIKWLRDELGIIGDAAESATLAANANKRAGLYFVPAFTGLGAPYWDPDARAAILGMTLDTGRAEIVRAALESVAYQTRDLMEAAGRDGALTPSALRVDGGMVVNDWFCQFLADTLGVPVERPKVIETTALGAAYLAGLSCGMFDSIEAVERAWARDRLFEPALSDDQRNAQYDGWQKAVARVLSAGS